MTEILIYFFRLGLTGFGGPLALIGQMQRELVIQRKWISEEEFRQALPLLKSMPGPVAFQTAVFLARKRSNALGGLLAGIAFITPSLLMMILLAANYETLKQNFFFESAMKGMQAGALVLIFWALQDLTSSYVLQARFWAYGFSALFLMAAASILEPLVILGLGLLAVFGGRIRRKPLFSVSLDLFWMAFKAGTLAFGTGLTIVPLLQTEVVRIREWMTSEQFLDALAFGQLTPGPVIITACFIGFKVFGWPGALITTLGVFGPPAFHMLTWFPRLLGWLSKQTWISDFLLGAIAALSAGILLALFQLGQNFTPAQFVIPLIILWLGRKRNRPGWLLILIAGLVHIGWSYFQLKNS